MTYHINPVHYGIETRYRVIELNDSNIVIREWIFDHENEAEKQLDRLFYAENISDYKMMQKSITEFNYDGDLDESL
jgi:hypothetical protein